MRFQSERLLGSLFDAVVDDEAFAALPQQIARFTGTVSTHIQIHSPAGAQTLASHGIGQDLLTAYGAYFWRHDAWAIGYERAALDVITTSDSYISDQAFRETEIYNDLLKRNGDLVRCLGSVSALGDGERLIFGAHRTGSQPMFEPELEQAMQILHHPMVHLIKARRRIAQGRGRLSQEIIDDLPDGIVVTNRSGQVRFANRAALNLLNEAAPLQLRARQLTGANAAISSSLVKLLTQACLGRGGDDLPLPAPFAAFSVSVDGLGGAERGLAVIRIHNEDHRVSESIARARDRYGLATVESQLAEALLKGRTPADFANHRGVGMATVRTHIRSLFMKVGVSRQADLILKLGRP